MKILFYTDSTTYGGAERYLSILIKGLKERGVGVSLAVPPGVDWYERAENLGIDLIRLRAIEGKKDMRGFLRQVLFFLRSDASLVHFNLPNPYHSQYSILAAMIARKPVVVTHHLPVLLRDVSWRGRVLEWILAKGIGKVITVSREGKRKVIEKLPLTCDRVRAIHNGIEPLDTTKIDRIRARRELGMEGEGIIIGSAGRLTEQKGYRYLLMAARELKAMNRDFFILIAGDGPLRKDLHEEVERLGLKERVRFLSFVEDIQRFLVGIDIFVLPSLYEGLPFVLLEAMGAGRPVIATTVGGIPEVVMDGVTGILVPPKDPLALSRAMGYLLENRKVATEMGRKGRERVERHFPSGRMVEATLEVYRELTGATG